MSNQPNPHASILQEDRENKVASSGLRLWTSLDVARFARCSLRQVGYWRQIGLPCLKLGQMVRFEPWRVLAWLRDHEA